MKTKFFVAFLFFILNLIVSAQDIKVISSDLNSIIIEYRPVYSDTTSISSQGQQFIKVNLLGGFAENFYKQGLPQVPIREVNVGVPSEFGNTIQIISADYSVLNGKYLPNPKLEKDSLGMIPMYAEGGSYSSFSSIQEVVAFGEFGMVRNLPVQTIKIYPVQFDGSSNTIRLFNKIVFKISFSPTRSNREIIKDNSLQSIVLNWDVAKNWGSAENKILQKISNSVLATGDWYRIETPEEGIYKIDRNFLQGLGIDAGTLDPKTIKIYGYGGYALPEVLSKSNNKGLIENAIQVVGEQDGKFDANDYILFYGRPPEFWEYSSDQKNIVRVKHPYSKKNYYWLTTGGVNGKRMNEKQSLNVQGAYQQQTTLSFKSLDDDKENLGKTGRDYFGDVLDFEIKSRTYLSSLNGIVPSSPVKYKFRIVNASQPIISFKLEESGKQIYTTDLWGNYTYVFGIENIGAATYNGTITEERSNLKFSISTGETSAKVYLDYFEITYQRFLRAVNDNLFFFSKDTTANIEYTISNFSNSDIQTFDVTDFANVRLIGNAAISGGQFRFQANETKNKVSKYLALTQSAYKTPVNGTKINNSNIRGNVAGSEMIVITARDFKTQAELYANYRANQSPYKLSTQVFYVEDILNEFAGGLLDPTAMRDFLKFAYENWQTKPMYLLLFGDGTYDYFNVEGANENFVPTYQTTESLDAIYSYTTDDYFARISGNDLKVDLAVGRLNIRKDEEAKTVVDKIIKYETGLEKGLWRNTVTLVADDGPAAVGVDDGSIHTSQSENLARNKIPKYIDENKIYLVAYPTVNTGFGRRKPAVNKAIIDAINNGTLIMNWTGHGNPSQWAHENVFEKISTIPQLKNDNYFFLTAATCDFGRYDVPGEQSSTEIMMNKENAGTIGTFTAVRAVFATANAAINDSLYTNLFRRRDENNLPIRIGKAYFLTKQYRTQDNDEKFHLFGDPAVRLNEPLTQARVDSVNSKALTSVVQLNALGSAKIKGSVKNSNGTLNPYNGETIMSVFDSERAVYFKEMNYTVIFPGGLIYRGNEKVTNGEFQTEFVVPKDISYENKNGKIVSYIFNNDKDGIGFTNNITVGGTNPNAVNDGKGPDIAIYFDRINFENSYLVNPTFTLIAKLSDQTGLNTTGIGIGHRLEGIINDDETNAVDFTKSFVGEPNSGGKSGTINYRFSSMEPGDYKIKIKAWDVFNNLSTKEAFFTVVAADDGIVVRDVFNYPNPFSSNTTFTFQHNVNSPINVKIKIYTVAGRMIKQIESWGLLDKFVRVDWDGRDEDGNQIANGTYLYKLIVESADGMYKNNVLGKLAVIR